MANLTFPSNPTNGQKVTVNDKVFVYNSTTSRWTATRLQVLGNLTDNFTIAHPELSLSNNTVAFSTTGETVYITYTVDQDVKASIATNGIANSSYANVTLHQTNNTIQITAGTEAFSSANVVLTVTNTRTSNTASIDLSAAYEAYWWPNVRSLMKVNSNSITDVTGTYTFTQNGSNGGPSTNRTKFASHSLEISSTYNVTTAGSFLQKNYGSSVTYEAWVWVNNRSSEFQIASNHDGTSYQARWYIATDGKMRIDSGSYDWDFAGQLVVPTGQWNHVVVQITAADANDRAYPYGFLNGVRGGAVGSSAFTLIQAGSGNTTIGPGPGYIESLQISEGEKYGGNPTMSPSMPTQELTQAYQN